MSNRKKNLIADRTCWGNEKNIKAIVGLEKILNEIGDPVLIGKVNRVICAFDIKLSMLSKVKKVNPRIKYLGDLVRNDVVYNIKTNGLPTKVETHLLNVIITKYKIFLNGNKKV